MFFSYDSNLSMIKNQIQARGINDVRVLEAFKKIDRSFFVPEEHRDQSYRDHPIDIGRGQTISQPYMVAWMTWLLEIEPHHRVLEIGTGSGYQTAILAVLAEEVHTMERIPELMDNAKKILKGLGLDNIFFHMGNGFEGLPDSAPFDRIVLTAAPEDLPERLLEQLKIRGKMVLPIGARYSYQSLYRITKYEDRIETEDMGAVAFVPMINN